MVKKHSMTEQVGARVNFQVQTQVLGSEQHQRAEEPNTEIVHKDMDQDTSGIVA